MNKALKIVGGAALGAVAAFGAVSLTQDIHAAVREVGGDTEVATAQLVAPPQQPQAGAGRIPFARFSALTATCENGKWDSYEGTPRFKCVSHLHTESAFEVLGNERDLVAMTLLAGLDPQLPPATLMEVADFVQAATGKTPGEIAPAGWGLAMLKEPTTFEYDGLEIRTLPPNVVKAVAVQILRKPKE